jgi:hypothetical protein
MLVCNPEAITNPDVPLFMVKTYTSFILASGTDTHHLAIPLSLEGPLMAEYLTY